MQKILFINPFGIGDCLFTTPLIKAVKENFPNASIGYWCNQRVEPVLKNNPHIDKTFALSRGDLKKVFRNSWVEGFLTALDLWRSLKKEHFDTAIDFSLDHRYGLVAKFLGINKRIGFNYKNRGRFLTEKANIDGYSQRHIVDYYLQLLSFLGITAQEPRLELFIPQSQRDWAKGFFKGAGVEGVDRTVAIAPAGGASWGKEATFKHWPPERFAALADKIVENYKAKIIIVANSDEKKIAKKMQQAMHSDAIDISGRVTLTEFAALLGEADLLVANDGGPLHMAAALGLKTISIFGPVDDKVYGPYPQSNRHIVVKKDLNCRPCYRNFRIPQCLRNRECIDSISVDEVYEAVQNLI
jgi:lipopolysaccharide heptosyltransferase II